MDLSLQTSIAATKFSENIAVIDGASKRKITYRELENEVALVSGGLLELGVKEGDALACFTPNCIDLVVWVWAAFRIGAHIVTVRPTFKEETAKMILEECNVKYTITEPNRARMINGNKILVGSLPHGKPYYGTERTIADDVTAAILYSSGTTGGPKGAVINRKQLAVSVESHIQYVGLTENDMSIAQLSLSGGFVLRNQLLASCVVGASFIIGNNIKEILDHIENYPVTLLYQPPPFTQMLLNDAKAKYGDRLPFTAHKLRAAIVSSDQAPLSVHGEFFAVFGKYICEGLGMSELGTYAYTPMHSLKTKDRCLGRPIAGVRLRIHDANSTSGIGEIVVAGEAVGNMYVNRPEANAKTFVAGELFTGDLGRLDPATGDLFFEGRKNNLISKGGLKIAPIEIEAPLENHPGIDRAVVTKLADAGWFEVPVAFLLLKEKQTVFTHEDLAGYLSQFIDDNISPKYFFAIDEFPLNGTGKVDRLELTKRAEQLVRDLQFLPKAQTNDFEFKLK